MNPWFASRRARGDNPAVPNLGILDRLVINVCQDCNLRCRYCYAEGGGYGGPRRSLTVGRARTVADYFLDAFGEIRLVQYFGGEPFLATEVIDRTCDHIHDRCSREGRHPPRFAVVTNGTRIDDRALDVIQRHAITVTVSLDGPQEIHDSLRVTAGGRGTFASVLVAIRRMKERTGQPSQVEGTFTALHLERSFSLVGFMDFLARDLDVHALHMPWILGDRCNGCGIRPDVANVQELLRIFGEGVDRSFQSLDGPDLEGAILLSIVERRLRAPRQFGSEVCLLCGAGSGTLSVATDGRIYPCFMFTNQRDLCLGRIDTTGPATLKRRRRRFVEALRLPAGSSIPVLGCAGVCHDQTGEVNRCLAAESWLGERLETRIDAHQSAARQDPERWEWLQVKTRLIGALVG
ncbi:MAG: radical SAM protein [Acidobacteriota bacterium]